MPLYEPQLIGAYEAVGGASRWIAADRFRALSNGNPAIGLAGGRALCMLFDAAALENANGPGLDQPVGWLTYDIDLYWTNAGAGAGDVSWTVTRMARATTDLLTNGIVTATAVVVAAPVLDVLKITTLVSGVAIDATKTMLQLNLYRDGTAAGDTLANDAAMLGLMLRRVT